MKLCGFEIGLDRPFFLIAGPCVVESEQLQMDTAGALKEITSALGIPFIFKSSYDKANRSSGTSFRGPGMEKGLEILANDVRCTHGATIGHVDEEQMYYLMARGLPRLEAQRLIVEGFRGEFVHLLEDGGDHAVHGLPAITAHHLG